VNLAIVVLFRELNVEITFSQQELHLRSRPGRLAGLTCPDACFKHRFE